MIQACSRAMPHVTSTSELPPRMADFPDDARSNVIHELYTTEYTYVRSLEVLVDVSGWGLLWWRLVCVCVCAQVFKDNLAPILGDEASHIFANVDKWASFSHAITCNHMQSHAITCNHMQSHAITCTRILTLYVCSDLFDFFWTIKLCISSKCLTQSDLGIFHPSWFFPYNIPFIIHRAILRLFFWLPITWATKHQKPCTLTSHTPSHFTHPHMQHTGIQQGVYSPPTQ